MDWSLAVNCPVIQGGDHTGRHVMCDHFSTQSAESSSLHQAASNLLAKAWTPVTLAHLNFAACILQGTTHSIMTNNWSLLKIPKLHRQVVGASEPHVSLTSHSLVVNSAGLGVLLALVPTPFSGTLITVSTAPVLLHGSSLACGTWELGISIFRRSAEVLTFTSNQYWRMPVEWPPSTLVCTCYPRVFHQASRHSIVNADRIVHS